MFQRRIVLSLLFFSFFFQFQNITVGLHYTLVHTWSESIFQKRQPTLPHNFSVSWIIQRKTQRTVFNNLKCMVGWMQVINLALALYPQDIFHTWQLVAFFIKTGRNFLLGDG